MKLTKQQLKRIIKEELLNEAVGGGIDEFAKRVGVAPLPPQFTNDELADFARELLKASPAKPKSATKGATGIHPLSLPIDRDDPKSGAGFALEKLIMKRVTKASGKQNQCMQRCKSARDTALSPAEFRRGEGVCTDECDKEWFKRDKEGNVVKDPRTKYAVSIIDDLRAVRDELLDVVDPTGGAKEWRAHATDLRGSDRRKDPMYGYEESKKRVTKSLLKQIIKEEIKTALSEGILDLFKGKKSKPKVAVSKRTFDCKEIQARYKQITAEPAWDYGLYGDFNVNWIEKMKKETDCLDDLDFGKIE